MTLAATPALMLFVAIDIWHLVNEAAVSNKGRTAVEVPYAVFMSKTSIDMFVWIKQLTCCDRIRFCRIRKVALVDEHDHHQ
jgi:hypothetical protein